MMKMARMLATGGLVMSLVLSGCGKATEQPADPGNANGESVTTKVDSNDASDGGEKGQATNASLSDLDGWWQVTSLTELAEGEGDGQADGSAPVEFGEDVLSDYESMFHTPCLFKVNAGEKTFEMSAWMILLEGTIDEQPSDGWFTLHANSGSGLYDSFEGEEGSKTARCRIEEDGNLTVEVSVMMKDGESDDSATSPHKMAYACTKSEELADKPSGDDLFDYAFETYLEYRNANMELPINWYDQPRLLAEKDKCSLILAGIGETDDEYILLAGVMNENQFPLIVGNYYTHNPIFLNGNTPVKAEIGCYMWGAPEGSADALPIYHYPIHVSKSIVNGNLTSVSGTLDITTIDHMPFTTLDFNITL